MAVDRPDEAAQCLLIVLVRLFSLEILINNPYQIIMVHLKYLGDGGLGHTINLNAAPNKKIWLVFDNWGAALSYGISEFGNANFRSIIAFLSVNDNDDHDI